LIRRDRSRPINSNYRTPSYNRVCSIIRRLWHAFSSSGLSNETAKRQRNLGMDMPKKQLVPEALSDLHRRLSTLPTRSPERRVIMQETANLYGASEQTLYRTLEQRVRPRALRRANRGTPTVLSQIRWSITANSLPPSTLLIFVLGARKMSC